MKKEHKTLNTPRARDRFAFKLDLHYEIAQKKMDRLALASSELHTCPNNLGRKIASPLSLTVVSSLQAFGSFANFFDIDVHLRHTRLDADRTLQSDSYRH